MLFISALDDDSDSPLPSQSQEKAKLDSEKLTGALPRAQQKVELDLDDSPFLEEEEEEEIPETQVEEAAEELAPPPDKRKKLIIFGAIGIIVIIILAVSAYFLFLKKKPAPPPPQVNATKPLPPPPPPIPDEKSVELEPFIVEFNDNGKIRFLICKFSLRTRNEMLIGEIKTKMLLIRDAIYYYLKNKSIIYLANEENVELLRNDLLTVVNQYLSRDRLDRIMIEDYLVK